MAQAILAIRYFDGQGVEKDTAAAEKWARRSSRTGPMHLAVTVKEFGLELGS